MKTLALRHIFNIEKGKKHSVSDTPSAGARRLLQIEDLRHDLELKYTNDLFGVEAGRNDVLLAWDGAKAGTIGYGKQGMTGSTIARLRVKEPALWDGAFLGTFLRTKYDYLQRTSTGATIPHINRKALERIEVPHYSLNEQRHVAALLNRVEGLIAQRKVSIRLLDELVRSVFLEMFGATNPKRSTWNVQRLEELASPAPNSIRSGPFGSDLLHSEFVDAGIAVLGIDNAVQNRFAWGQLRYITPKKYEGLKRYTVSPGDVLITIMATNGRSAVVPEGIPLAINSKHLACLSLNRKKADPYFISYSIHSDPHILAQVRARHRGAIMTGLNLSLIKSLKFSMPPLNEQEQFADLYNFVEKIKEVYAKSLDAFELLYGSLSQRAFRGELKNSIAPDHEASSLKSSTSGINA